MKVCVVGHRGMLARDLVPRLKLAGFSVACAGLPDIDITKPDKTLSYLEGLSADLIINCAAYTFVDKAESEPEKAFSVNRDGAMHLAQASANLSIPLIHISTDFIFDGNASRPYSEEDPVRPLSIYGKSKWEGEEAIRAHLEQHLIVRTAWLFGSHGHNFVKTMLRLARDREEIRVVADQWGCPTWTGHLADALVDLTESIREAKAGIDWGTYHFSGSGNTTWHGFTESIVKQAKRWERLRVCRIVPITTSEYPTPAQRPKWSVLDCSKIQRNFGINTSPWTEGLVSMLTEINEH